MKNRFRAVCLNMLLVLGLTNTPTMAQLAPATTSQQTLTRYTYDRSGKLATVTDALGATTGFSYDQLQRLVSVRRPDYAGNQFAYDVNDRVNGFTDSRSATTQYTVDGLGNQTGLASPATGVTQNSYDDAGNLVASIDAKGQRTSYTYDALNRKTGATYADDTVVSWLYDIGPYALGRLSQVIDSSGSTSYAYDRYGRVVSEVRSIGGRDWTTSYRHDAAGRVAGLTYPGGRSIEYGYDVMGRINTIAVKTGDLVQPLVMQVNYQPFGPAQLILLGNGQSIERSFDLDGRIDSYTLNGQRKNITYDAGGRIGALRDAADPANDVSNSYDILGRQTSYQKGTERQVFSYDAAGNRTVVSSSAGHSLYTYFPGNRMANVSGWTQVLSDANGSILRDPLNQYNYDARGRMSSAQTPVARVSYQVNGLGQRVQKIAPGGATIFYYDLDGKLIGERSGERETDYVYLNDLPIAVLRDGEGTAVATVPAPAVQGPDTSITDPTVPEASVPGASLPETPSGDPTPAELPPITPAMAPLPVAIFYIFSDHLNTPRLITDANGGIVWNWDSEPFGSTPANSQPGASPPFEFNLRFPGQYFDSESKLHYNYFRDYDPATGRYVESDPIGLAGGENTFTYVAGQPTRYSDPRGLNPVGGTMVGAEIGSMFGPIGTIVGGAIGAGFGAWAGWNIVGPMFAKPPANAYDPNGAKAPGKPGEADGFRDPKGGENWVPNPNPGKGGSSFGWQDAKGDVWCPTGSGGRGHGGPHWDVQTPGGDYRNAKPSR